MAHTRNIVILGASCAGLGTAHYLCKHVLPKLQNIADTTYVLHLVDPSTHFWWHVAAPREIVSVDRAKHDKYFVPIADGFAQYTSLKDKIVFHQASATALDIDARTVQVTNADGAVEDLPYYALVIATGTRSPTPLTTLHGAHTISQQALEKVNADLLKAKDVIISGGGPVGVETAGEIGSHLKGKAKVTLIAGSEKLLPVLNDTRARKAQKLLEKVGVSVLYGSRTVGEPTTNAEGRTVVTLDNGTTMECDVFIPAFGVQPNTDFIPPALKTDKGYLATNSKTLRVDGAGTRVYAVGDVAGVDRGGVLNMNNSIIVSNANIAHDLLTDAAVFPAPVEKSYNFKETGTQVVPVGPKSGVGVFNGFGLPGFVIAMVKGKDFLAAEVPKFTQGTGFTKA